MDTGSRGTIKDMKTSLIALVLACALCTSALAAPLGTNTRTVLPAQIQQIISVDYRSLRNSPSGMALKNRVLPENLKAFETSLRGMGVNPDTDVEQLTFVAYRTAKGAMRSFGVANGQFEPKKVVAPPEEESRRARNITTPICGPPAAVSS